MTLKEFNNKWRVGEPEKVIRKAKIYTYFECRNETELGDLIKTYIKHLNTKKWKRNLDWKYIEAKIRKILNQITLVWYN